MFKGCVAAPKPQLLIMPVPVCVCVSVSLAGQPVAAGRQICRQVCLDKEGVCFVLRTAADKARSGVCCDVNRRLSTGLSETPRPTHFLLNSADSTRLQKSGNFLAFKWQYGASSLLIAHLAACPCAVLCFTLSLSQVAGHEGDQVVCLSPFAGCNVEQVEQTLMTCLLAIGLFGVGRFLVAA